MIFLISIGTITTTGNTVEQIYNSKSTVNIYMLEEVDPIITQRFKMLSIMHQMEIRCLSITIHHHILNM